MLTGGSWTHMGSTRDDKELFICLDIGGIHDQTMHKQKELVFLLETFDLRRFQRGPVALVRNDCRIVYIAFPSAAVELVDEVFESVDRSA
jgi:hypothetical protein